MIRMEFCLLDGSAHNGLPSRKCPKCFMVRQRLWRKTKPGKKYAKKWNKAYELKPGFKAKTIVAIAVRKGVLPRVKTLTCVDCFKPARCYDHREYAKPLIVEPVCFSCNAKRGPAKDAK